ncbi:MarR family winged helix-turn-helix transcriptional regulator [Herbivorax sp. ANBcel31]|uniref:MarR family winged helix-turn-helix transcriptional regulator n=1 Tax=Herbivorax sp. ANBcel31 TaxID=3069754 RepID=UPI0027B0F8D2|nr:MarR family winged helix-turn-helix transcriptional regulator [Herbivorax sp. ANBcel31]MDQ2085681.1 MarR family winged helix-turn-helix transcriptional regulator [Herbivorax sp. ANBcel31]
MSRRRLIENYLTVLPVLYKTMFKGLPDCSVTKLQMELLYHLKIEGGMPMNYYGKKIMVSKPNMSVLAEKMIEEGLVEKGTLENDKRVSTLKLTKRGGDFLDEEMTKFTRHLLDKLSVFSDEDIERLNDIVKEVQVIFSKLKNVN